MKIDKIRIENYGAIERLDINFDFENANPISPTILVGANGSGKTLFLSHMVDALIELKRKKYNKMLEVQEDNYYRVGHKSYIRHGKLHSYVEVQFHTDSANKITYTDIMTKNPESFISEYSFKEEQLNVDTKFKEHGFFRKVSGEGVKDIDENILLYFPSSRYSVPSWLHIENQQYRLTKHQNFIGHSSRNIIKENVLSEIENWILNLVMDKHLYEIKTEKFLISKENGLSTMIDRAIYINGRNTQLLNMLNKLLTIIYKLKYPKIDYARIGVSSKENRKVVVIIKESGVEDEVEVAPTFGHLSSGEAMLISLFGSLLKEYDEITNNDFKDIKEVSGIVLVDEIDLNLHIKFAKEILPELIKEFPKVQFIITTHSPFFLLGMENNYKEKYRIFNLPHGHEINIFDFQEVKIAYETFLEGFSDFQNDFNNLKEQLSIITKPLIITEGKTDWKHFKGILNRFKENNEYKELDVEFFEVNDKSSLSDDKLNKMLNELSKVNTGKKIIGIFDSDAQNGKRYSTDRYTHLGNNVYAMSIPTPGYRENQTNGISIEFLYKNEDLLKMDSNGRRIFLSNEFNKDGRLKENLVIGVRNSETVKSYLDENNAKIVDSDVINIEGNSVALSKNAFAEYILNGTAPFDNVDIEGFREVFERVKEIIFNG